MPGMLPQTRLLVLKNGIKVGDCASWQDVACVLGVSVSDDGVVSYDGVPQHPHYIYDRTGSDWNAFTTKGAIASDWVKHHLRDRNISIYRYLIRR